MTRLPMPIELNDADLDAVAAGAGANQSVDQALNGLVNVAVGANVLLNNISVLSNNNTNVLAVVAL